MIHVSEVGKCICAAEQDGLESFYVEILAKPGRRARKPGESSAGGESALQE